MITFNTAEIKFVLKNKTTLKNWISRVVDNHQRTLGDISFVFCSDEYLLAMNKQYLQHNTFTDVITFDYSKNDRTLPVSGDIFISIDRISDNAKKYSKTTENELHRVMIHGVLHLLGYGDKTKIAKTTMTSQEDKCLKMLNQISKK